MSKILADFLEEKLKPTFDTDTGAFPDYIQEEYMTEAGYLDRDYLTSKLGIHLSMDTFRKTVKQCFNQTTFLNLPVESSLHKDDFIQDVYEFGKMKNMRSWIGVTYVTTGQLITRKDVFDAIIGA